MKFGHVLLLIILALVGTLWQKCAESAARKAYEETGNIAWVPIIVIVFGVVAFIIVVAGNNNSKNS